MKFTKGNIALRAGLGFVFLYAGISSIVDPQQWMGFVPGWVESFGVSRELALLTHAGMDIVLALWITSGVQRRWAGVVAFISLVGIVVASGPGLLPTTFRDIGLALAALAYADFTVVSSDKDL
jgi:uncharacterized membrane protein YphA (DoxX/SURF4 family)